MQSRQPGTLLRGPVTCCNLPATSLTMPLQTLHHITPALIYRNKYQPNRTDVHCYSLGNICPPASSQLLSHTIKIINRFFYHTVNTYTQNGLERQVIGRQMGQCQLVTYQEIDYLRVFNSKIVYLAQSQSDFYCLGLKIKFMLCSK